MRSSLDGISIFIKALDYTIFHLLVILSIVFPLRVCENGKTQLTSSLGQWFLYDFVIKRLCATHRGCGVFDTPNRDRKKRVADAVCHTNENFLFAFQHLSKYVGD